MLRWYAMCKVKCADERYGDLSVHILKCESTQWYVPAESKVKDARYGNMSVHNQLCRTHVMVRSIFVHTQM